MSTAAVPAPARFSVRGAQLSRAALAILAAIMITFSSDHSAVVGLAVFSGFAIATGIVIALSAWLTYPAGRRWGAVLLAVLALLAGMVSGVPATRTTTGFFVIVIAWALLSGMVELLWGLRERRRPEVLRADARDTITVGAIGLLLGVGLLLVQPDFALDYFIEDANVAGTLTGITIGVGVFGGYAAIVGVYLAIAAFSPRPEAAPAAEATAGDAGSEELV